MRTNLKTFLLQLSTIAIIIIVGLYYIGTEAAKWGLIASTFTLTSDTRRLTSLQKQSHNASAWSAIMSPATATDFFKESGRNISVLVIVNGQLRGGSIAWNSMQEYLLDFYNADLALIGPPFTPTDDEDLIEFRNRAKYVWTQPELDDWGDILDSIGNSSSWRGLCTYHKSPNCTRHKHSAWQFLGGVKNCHEGSSGILLAYRYLTLQKILQTSILNDYDWFIYTRADYTYLCSPQPLSYFSSDYVYVPNSQGFGGITDRHTYIPRKLVTKVLNVTEHIVSNWKFWLDELCASNDPFVRSFNVERALFWYFNFVGIPFKRFWHSAFTVRRDEDPTRWQEGHVHHIMKEYALKVKYPGEVDEATISCDPWKRFSMTNPLPHKLKRSSHDELGKGNTSSVISPNNKTNPLPHKLKRSSHELGKGNTSSVISPNNKTNPLPHKLKRSSHELGKGNTSSVISPNNNNH